jgi:hypothetical protein
MQQQRSITITNTSRLPLQFSWTMQQLQLGAAKHSVLGAAAAQLIKDSSSSSACHTSAGDDSQPGQEQTQADLIGQLSLHISPASGWLEPQQSLQLQLLLEPTRVGPVQLLCCCEVPAMSQLAGFVVEAVVEGLQIGYAIERQPQLSQGSSSSRGGIQQLLGDGVGESLSAAVIHGNAAETAEASAGQEPLLADFGVTAIHQPCELVLRVTNLTSISTTYRAWVARFPAAAAAAEAEIQTGERSTGRQQELQGSADGAAAAVHSAKGSRVGSAAGMPISTLPALPAPAQQQQQLSTSRALVAQFTNGSSSSGSQMWPRRTGSGNQQQQQRSSIAARLAAAVSAGNAAGHALGGSLCSSALLTGNFTAAHLAGSLPKGLAGSALQQQQQQQQQSISLPGPFRSSAGNIMMAARQVAAAAAAALGQSSSGCAVCVQPWAGQLPGWGCVELQLLAYSNLPGTYVDELCIQVSWSPTE